MSKCKLPPRETTATIDGVPGKKLHDACTSKYLGSVVDDPTPAAQISTIEPNTQICGEKQCHYLSESGELTYAPAGTPFTPGVEIGSLTDDPTPHSWRVEPLSVLGFLLLLIAAYAALRFQKSVRARSSRSEQ